MTTLSQLGWPDPVIERIRKSAARVRRGRLTRQARLFTDMSISYRATGSEYPHVDAARELYDPTTGKLKPKWQAQL